MKKLLLLSLFVFSSLYAMDSIQAQSVFDQGYYVVYESTVNVGTAVSIVSPNFIAPSKTGRPICDAVEIAPPVTDTDVYYSQTITTDANMPVGMYVITAVGKKYSNNQYGIREVALKKSSGTSVVTVRWLNKKQLF